MSDHPVAEAKSKGPADVALLREAAAAYKEGKKDRARALLNEATAINPNNELVWLWHASLARTVREAMDAVERVLELDPSNAKALQWRSKLESRLPESERASRNGAGAPPAEVADEAQPETAVEEQAATAAPAEEAEVATTAETETESIVAEVAEVDRAEVETDQQGEQAETEGEDGLTADAEAAANIDSAVEVAIEAAAEEAATEQAAEEQVLESAAEEESRPEIGPDGPEARSDDGQSNDAEQDAGEIVSAVAADEQGDAEGDIDSSLAALEQAASEAPDQSAGTEDIWEALSQDSEQESGAQPEDGSIRSDGLLAEAAAERQDDAGQYAADQDDVAADDDPIRRLLAEKSSGQPRLDAPKDDETDYGTLSSVEAEDASEEGTSYGTAADKDATLAALFGEPIDEATQDIEGTTEIEPATVSDPIDQQSAEAEAEAETETPATEAVTAKNPWECPLCGQQSHRAESSCPHCQSFVDFGRLEDMARNDQADRVALKRVIADGEEQAEREPTVEVHRRLALAYLNLRQSNAALPHLLAAARLDRDDDGLKAALEQISRRTLILVVDDSRTVQRMVASTLERELYRVIIAEDGLQALAKLNEELPNLILLDITMPRMDGYQVCKVITSNASFKHIPVVMLSGKDGFFDKVRGRMVGAADYITKPFEASALLQAVAARIKVSS